MSLLDKIKDYIKRESLLKEDSRVIIGLSGGADSVCLLAVMTRLGYDCVAVHCHFGLRGPEADRDAEFSGKIAAKLGAEFILRRFDTKEYARRKGVSIEMACRDLRYEAFEALRNEFGAEVIAVGHHREDNVETMFLNLLRGCGIHGVRGMLPRTRNHVIRPLLDVSRAEILNYLESEGLDFIVDSSNLENDVKRNKLRNVVIPAIVEQFPDAMTTLSRSVNNLRECARLYDRYLPQRSDSLEGVDSTLLHEWLAPYGFNADQCQRMLSASPGAQFDSEKFKVTICPGRKYELTETDKEQPEPKLIMRRLKKDDGFSFKSGCLYLDTDSLPQDARFEVRRWKEGDRMIPFGMKGSRLVSDIMNDCGISASRRRYSHLLTINDDIVWIIGHRTSALYPITEKTEIITEISISHEDI